MADTTKHMLSGHAYARAVRGHILVHLSLPKIIFEQIIFTTSEKQLLNNMFDSEDYEHVLNSMNLLQ